MAESAPGEIAISMQSLTDSELVANAKAILDEFKRRNAKSTLKLRCPCCNKPLQRFHNYQPTWEQCQMLFQALEMMQRAGVKHFHIKSELKLVGPDDRDHTMVGAITNHYSKMLYLKLLTRCKRDGTPIPHFDYTHFADTKHQAFTVPDRAVQFILGRMPLSPCKVRVHNKKIVEVPENTHSSEMIRDVYLRHEDATEGEQQWLHSSGQMAIHFPLALSANTQGELFDNEED
jgi:hypothetical protein